MHKIVPMKNIQNQSMRYTNNNSHTHNVIWYQTKCDELNLKPASTHAFASKCYDTIAGCIHTGNECFPLENDIRFETLLTLPYFILLWNWWGRTKFWNKRLLLEREKKTVCITVNKCRWCVKFHEFCLSPYWEFNYSNSKTFSSFLSTFNMVFSIHLSISN